MKTVLTIAGSDSSGVGGIQADIKTITSYGLYAMSAITSMTAQNTTGVYDIQESKPKFLARQIECVFDDIYPDAVKIGMVSNAELVDVIAEKLSHYKAKNIVLDTSIVSSGGRRLVGDQTERIILEELVPLATVILPSIPEAENMSGVKIDSIEDLGVAAGIISAKYNVQGIFFKDSHKITDKGDLLFENGKTTWIPGVYPQVEKVKGKGCALSAAITCGLAMGRSLTESVQMAKQYVTDAVSASLPLGKGGRPIDHMAGRFTV